MCVISWGIRVTVRATVGRMISGEFLRCSNVTPSIAVDKARLDEVGIRQEEEHPEFVLPSPHRPIRGSMCNSRRSGRS
jgi:hypothetical protein